MKGKGASVSAVALKDARWPEILLMARSSYSSGGVATCVCFRVKKLVSGDDTRGGGLLHQLLNPFFSVPELVETPGPKSKGVDR
jgi:hypothetical protein